MVLCLGAFSIFSHIFDPPLPLCDQALPLSSSSGFCYLCVVFLRGNCTRTMRKLANIIFLFNSTFLFLNLKQISKYISYLHLHLFEVLIRFISVLILGIARKCSSFSWRQEGPLFNRRYIYFLAFKRLVNNNFNYLIFLFKEII